MPYLLTSNPAELFAIKDVTGLEFETANNSRELVRLLEHRTDEDLVVVSADFKFDEAIYVAERMRTSKPSLSVILLRDKFEMDLVKKAMSSGVRDVILTTDRSNLTKACEKAIKIGREIRLNLDPSGSALTDECRVITVYSAKGGVGKTTISTSLAIALANQGKKTCLLDFDIQFGDVGVTLGINDDKSIVDALPLQEEYSAKDISDISIAFTPNLDVILAPTSPVLAEQISGPLAEKLIARLIKMYDYVIVDSPPAFTDVILAAFDKTDKCLVVTTPDSTALKNLVLAVSTLNKIGFDLSRFQVIVNRFDRQFGYSQNEIESLVKQITGINQVSVIPESDEVLKASIAGKPLIPRSGKGKVVNIFNQLANEVQRHNK